MTTSKIGLGYIYVVLAAVLWATSGTAAKHLFLINVSPFELVQLRTTISSVMLFAWLRRTEKGVLKIPRNERAYTLFLGTSFAVTQFAYLYAISRIHVAVAILLQYQAPVFIVLYKGISLRAMPSRSTLLAIAGAISGCYLMVGAYSLNILSMNKAGMLAGLASAVSFAFYSVKAEHGMHGSSPWKVLFRALFFAAVVWNILYPPFKAFSRIHDISAWGWVLYIVVFGTILPYGLYNKGISLISSTRASITATLEPVFASIIAYVLLGETMEWWQVFGAMLVLSSVLFIQFRSSQGIAEKET